MIYLHPEQVEAMIKQAEVEDETIVVRCIRKTPASKMDGPDQGDLQDLHCVRKPDYTKKTEQDRQAQDKSCGVLTVYVSNRRNRATGEWGDWRRVNIQQVRKVIYKGTEYEVTAKAF
jgi:hypothetical protein